MFRQLHYHGPDNSLQITPEWRLNFCHFDSFSNWGINILPETQGSRAPVNHLTLLWSPRSFFVVGTVYWVSGASYGESWRDFTPASLMSPEGLGAWWGLLSEDLSCRSGFGCQGERGRAGIWQNCCSLLSWPELCSLQIHVLKPWSWYLGMWLHLRQGH